MSRVASIPGASLVVSALHAWYGGSQVLHGVDFAVRKGEVVALLGRNGVGKTTTLKAIMGIVPRREGSVRYGDTELIAHSPERIARAGLAYCPEDRGIFASLSVEENLLLPPVLATGGIRVSEIYSMFPNLAARRANSGAKLSGGEQQMLAIARILRSGATLFLLDEPTEGLAPVIVERIGAVIRNLKQKGFGVLLVEQNIRFAAALSDKAYVMEHGRIVDMFAGDRLHTEREQVEQYLAV